jgi:hypothetical protein
LDRIAMLALFTKPVELLTVEDVTAVVGWPEPGLLGVVFCTS